MTIKTVARHGTCKYMQLDTNIDYFKDKSLQLKYSWKESLQQH